MSGNKSSSDFHQPTGRLTYSPRLFSVCLDAHGQRWAAWHATEGRVEVIRVISPEVCPESARISEPGLHFEPTLAAAPNGGVWCVWSSRFDGQWRLAARLHDKGWEEAIAVPTAEDFAFHAASVSDTSGGLWVAYSAWNGGQSPTVRCRRFGDTNWSPEIVLSDPPAPQMWPRLAAGADGTVWLAFCEYRHGAFCIATASFPPGHPETPTVTILPKPQDNTDWDLFPSLCVDEAGGAWVAWITCRDVDRAGVVGRQTNLNCARWDGSAWAPPPGCSNFTVTHLDWGMLPVKTYWGYNGLRRRAQLAADANGIWVFWERHRDEQALAENVANGQFCAKYHDGTGWSDSYLVYDRHSCFTVDSASPQPADTLVFACKTAPSERPLDIGFRQRSRAKLLVLEEHPRSLWATWQPVSLPGQITGPLSPHTTTCHGETFELIWGDLHCHSYYSPDAEGEPMELLIYARDRAGLDFCCIIDNDYYPDIVMSHSALDYLYAVAQSFSDQQFLAFWGYEYTYHEANGDRFPKNHRAVVYYDRDQPLARRCDPDGHTTEAFVTTMNGSASLWHAHHEEWALLGHAQEENVEVCAGWADYMQVSDVVQRHLKRGFRFGLMGASDNHRIVPGLGGAVTGLYVRERSHEGIVEALKQRRCYATTGCRLVLDFRINDHMMGSIVQSADPPRLKLLAISRRRLASVRVLRDEQIMTEFHPHQERFEWQAADLEAPPGLHFYRVEVQEEGEVRQFPHNIAQAAGIRAYSSPVWVRIAGTSELSPRKRVPETELANIGCKLRS